MAGVPAKEASERICGSLKQVPALSNYNMDSVSASCESVVENQILHERGIALSMEEKCVMKGC